MGVLDDLDRSRPSSSGSLLDLTDIGSQISKQQTLETQGASAAAGAQKRAAIITSAATADQIGIQEAAIASGEDTRKKQLDVMDGINGQLSKAKVAMTLSDSKNPLDHIKLWALQQGDPSFTREGNSNRISYLQKASDALGGVELLKQGGYQAQMDASKLGVQKALEPDQEMLAQLQIGIDQGKRVIDAAKSASETRYTLMSQNDAMQSSALSNMDLSATANAEQLALNTPTKTVNVGGVELSLAQIQDRKEALADRSYHQITRDILTGQAAVSQLTSPDVDAALAQATADKTNKVQLADGTSVSVAQLQTRKLELQNGDLGALQDSKATADILQSIKKTNDFKVLSTMTPTELNDIVSNGGVDPKRPSDKYGIDDVINVRNMKQDASDTALKQKVGIAAIGDPGQALTDFDSYLKTVQANVPTDGPLGNLLRTQTQIFQFSAAALKSSNPAEVLFGAAAMQGTRETIEKGIDAEAVRVSNGDKDKEAALKHQYRGEAIPGELVATAINNKITKHQPLTGWLSAENSAAFTKVFYQAQQDIQAANPGMDKAAIQSQAVEQAMGAIIAKQSQGMTEKIIGSAQLMVPNNPLKAVGMTPPQLLSMYRDSDLQGIKNYQDHTGTSDADMQKLIQSGDPAVARAQAAAMYTSLEKIKPGLGQQYTDWWNSDARDSMVQLFSKYAQATSSKAGFAELAATSLVLPTLDGQMSQYATILSDGQKSVYASDLKNQHAQYVMFQGDPAAKQAFLLEQDKNLSPSEKQSAMTLIFQPMLKDIADQKLNAEQASTYIESNLKTMKSDDPAIKKLQTKIMQGRDSSLKVIDDFIQSQGNANPIQQFAGNLASIVGFPFGTQAAIRTGQIQGQMQGFPWYQDWVKAQQGGK